MKINNIEVEHLPITLRNELVCRVAYQKAKEFAQSKNLESALVNIARLRTKHDVLHELIDELGMLNSKTLQRHMQMLKDNHYSAWKHDAQQFDDDEKPEYQPMTDDAAKAIAEKEMQDNLKTYIKDNIEIGKQLYFDTEKFPTTIEALKIGIGIIKETVDKSKLNIEQSAAIESELDSDYWQNVSAREVADYVDYFCKSFK